MVDFRPCFQLHGFRSSDEIREYNNALIPGLPDELSLECMARVPKTYHGALKCVSVQWRDLVGSEVWYSHRKKHGLEEPWVYAVGRDMYDDRLCCYVLDPARASKGWRKIRGVPMDWTRRRGFRFVASGKRFYLLGGHGWGEDATDDVACYDANEGCWTWRLVPRMPTPRCKFACQVMDGVIFALGGEGPRGSNPKSLDSYNPQTRRWTSHPDPNFLDDIDDSVVMNGKIYVRHRGSKTTAYDVSRGKWEDADPDMASGWQGPAVVVDGTLYALENSSNQMMKWQNDTKNWVSAGYVSTTLHALENSSNEMMKWQNDTRNWVSAVYVNVSPPCQLVAVGKNIYIVGQGLQTRVFNTENGWDLQNVCYSTSNIDVIGCTSVAT